MGSNCQSCGMPLSKDPDGGGTNTDGTRSQTYCSFCYENGAFVQSDMDVTAFQAHVGVICNDHLWRGNGIGQFRQPMTRVEGVVAFGLVKLAGNVRQQGSLQWRLSPRFP